MKDTKDLSLPSEVPVRTLEQLVGDLPFAGFVKLTKREISNAISGHGVGPNKTKEQFNYKPNPDFNGSYILNVFTEDNGESTHVHIVDLENQDLSMH